MFSSKNYYENAMLYTVAMETSHASFYGHLAMITRLIIIGGKMVAKMVTIIRWVKNDDHIYMGEQV